MRSCEFIVESLAVGTSLDLSRNWGNFSRLVGRVKEVAPNGKLKIQIVTAEPMPGKKGAVQVGDIVSLAPNYVKRSAIINTESR